jgi:hypothetical protein
VASYTALELATEARQALDRFWFLTHITEASHGEGDYTARLHIQPGVFVQLFLGNHTHALYIALIRNDRRMLGLDFVAGAWHMHPLEDPVSHQMLADGWGPRPLMAFLSRVEAILIDEGLI